MAEQFKPLSIPLSEATSAIRSLIPHTIFARAQSIVENHRPKEWPEGFIMEAHHTIQRFGMTYAGLNETREEAEQAKAILVDKERNTKCFVPQNLRSLWSKEEYSQMKAAKNAEEWENEGQIVELQEGQIYRPWGDILYTRTHGVNDGTHGSQPLKGF